MYSLESADSCSFITNAFSHRQEETRIFPNPADDRIAFKIPDAERITLISFYNSLGRLVKETSSYNKTEGINLVGMEPGLYMVRVLLGKSSYFSRLILGR